jgi:hypothetical protein
VLIDQDSLMHLITFAPRGLGAEAPANSAQFELRFAKVGAIGFTAGSSEH